MSRDLASLFDPPPPNWGLRGDPELWAAMRGLAAGTRVADRAAAETALTALFAGLAGTPLDSDAPALPLPLPLPLSGDRPSGGMSTGMVSPAFWRDTGLPLLLSRFEAQDD